MDLPSFDAEFVFVGDPRQLPEVDAGGTFSAIARRIEPLHVTENRRQHATATNEPAGT